jgi:hypothetical protein
VPHSTQHYGDEWNTTTLNNPIHLERGEGPAFLSRNHHLRHPQWWTDILDIARSGTALPTPMEEESKNDQFGG